MRKGRDSFCLSAFFLCQSLQLQRAHLKILYNSPLVTYITKKNRQRMKWFIDSKNLAENLKIDGWMTQFVNRAFLLRQLSSLKFKHILKLKGTWQ